MDIDKEFPKSIDTSLSAGCDLQNETIREIKEYLHKNYKNIYNLPPHLTFMISPFPKDNLSKIEKELDEYFANKGKFSFKTEPLDYSPKRKFFSLPVKDPLIMDIHADMVELFNKYREGYVRAKDLERMKAGVRDEKDVEYIRRYGYPRVFDNFTPHLSLGSVECDDSEIPAIRAKLEEMLSQDTVASYQIDKILIIFHTDAVTQTDMQNLWEKEYTLL